MYGALLQSGCFDVNESSVEEGSLGFDGGRLGEVGLGAEVLQERVLSVGKLDKEAVNTLVNKVLGLIVDSGAVGQVIVLVSVRVHGQVQVVHLLDVRAVVAVSFTVVSFGLLDPVERDADSVSVSCDIVEVVGV